MEYLSKKMAFTYITEEFNIKEFEKNVIEINKSTLPRDSKIRTTIEKFYISIKLMSNMKVYEKYLD